MGLFDLFKEKKQSEETKKNKVLLAMPMFNKAETFELDKVVDNLRNNWKLDVSDIIGDNKTVTFSIQGMTIALGTMPVQIPWEDIEKTAQYAYNWPDAIKELKDHDSHIIVSVMSKSKSDIEQYVILTKVLSSILSTSNCIGVYQGSQSLLLSKKQYLESAEELRSNKIPVDLWIYIGLRKGEKGNSAYTYGLKAFDKIEMEFLDAKLELHELHSFLTNICAYIINSDVNFQSGQTLGYTAEQKISISQSKGVFVEGQTLKLNL
jgi:hypothetical protein